VSVGDVVSVSARPVVGQDGCWVVDNDGGLVVVHPDTLISGTTVVGSLFCMRRSVLSDMYRGVDSDSSIMVIGSFLHQLLQEVIKIPASPINSNV
jgi:DNA replication ATP-dependent helicase Dna2